MATKAKSERPSTKDRLLDAAETILAREGFAGLTMERVAAESGVAKTTLYRRWPTKAALCMDLYLELAARELRVPDSGNLEDDLRYITDTVVHLQTRTVAGQAFLGLIAEAQVNPATREALREFAERRREVTRAVLRRAIERREIPRETDVDLVIDALGGAVTFRLTQGHAPLTKKFTRDLVKLIVAGCKAQKPSRRRAR